MLSRTFDLNSQSYKQNPYPTLARMVAEGPVVRVRFPWLGKLWMVTRYEAASELLRDRERFVREPRSAGMPQRSNLPWWFPRSMQPMAEVMINRDEPDHRRLRGLVDQAFLRHGVEQLRPRFDAIMRQMLDELEVKFRRDGHPIDLVAGLARPFPLAVISELLGLPAEDRPMFAKLAGAFSGRPSPLVLYRMLGAIKSINTYIREQIRICRAKPRQGLISELISARQEDERLTEDEMVSMVILLLLAGHMTTVHLIGAGLYTLLTHPEQKRSLLSDGSLVETTVDELLRYLSPVQMTKPMMPVRDLEWHGKRLQRGEKVVALLAAANVDPQKFEHPDRFDIHRSPNPHLAFGAGIHVCLGLRLARAEAEIALEQLLNRFPKLELAIPPSQVTWSRQLGTRGMEALPVRLM
ncbi:hypothetical protein/cytochrome P450 PksS [Singulisphaera sp. GP187]|uniref:cytochrome P450 family protein n=1 Tax=Singulisphaera sp. GP187 TaxID=1882752 RepID=UPI000927836E|nr:cytochrome P450 [Singulisphaera sp. GP187]SIO60584.1 hypothetical protein/cytochrome P450 PksS [Singulisphaera sp. GP187]